MLRFIPGTLSVRARALIVTAIVAGAALLQVPAHALVEAPELPVEDPVTTADSRVGEPLERATVDGSKIAREETAPVRETLPEGTPRLPKPEIGADLVVSPGAPGDWAFRHAYCGGGSSTGTGAFASGPATPPLGLGSANFTIGSDGDSFEEIRNDAYDGTLLSDLTTLSYSTFVSSAYTDFTGQASYLLLNLDLDGVAGIDDQLFFEPVYQTGTYGGDTVPDQGTVTQDTWQTWDALAGGWWTAAEGFGGPPVHTIANYVATNPTATIVNSSTGLGGLRISHGCGGGAWDGFIGAVDALTIGVGGVDTEFDFEISPAVPTVTIVDGGDGFINDAEDNAVTLQGTYDNSNPNITSVIVRITNDPACDAGASGTPVLTATLDGAGNWTAGPFDISSALFAENVAVCARARAQYSNGDQSDAATSNTPIKDTSSPGVGTVAYDGAYALDGYINAAEAAAADPAGRPVIWTTPGGDAATAEGRFADSTDTLIPGGSCGNFALGISGGGYLNLPCMGTAPEGEVRWQVRWFDAAGNSGSWASASITVDRLSPDAPAVTIDTDPITSLNDDSVGVTVDGESGALAEVSLTDGTLTTPSQSATLASPTSFTFDASALSDGTIDADATLTDPAGNTSSGGTDDVLKDTVVSVPSVVIDTDPINSGNVGSVDVTVDGDTGDDVEVSLSDGTNSTASQTVTLASPATLTFDAGALLDGTITATATATDSSGNVSGSATDTSLKDTVVLAGTLVSDDANGYLSAAEISSCDGGTGLGCANDHWDANASSDATSATLWWENSDGSIPSACGPYPGILPTRTGWLPPDCGGNLNEGTISRHITWQDAAGNSSSEISYSLIKDSIAPDAPSVTIDTDPITSLNDDSVGVTVDGESGALAEVSLTDGTLTTPSQSATLASPTSFTFDASALSDGTIDADATLTDPAGNTSAGGTDDVLKDTVASVPSVVIDTDPINLSNVGTVEVTVDGETGSQVEVALGDGSSSTASQTVTLASPATLTFDAGALLDGTITATATATDSNGNVSGSATDTATKDTVAPAAGTLTIQDSDGYLNAAEVSTGLPVDWSGPADAASASVWFEDADGNILADCGPWGEPVSGAGALPPGCAANLPQGTFSFIGTWTDAAGNTSAEGSDTSIKDSIAPDAPSVIIDTDPISAANETAVQLSGVAEPGSTVNAYLTDGTFTVTGSPVVADGTGAYSVTIDSDVIPDGTVTGAASATDEAGNTGATGSDTAIKDTVAQLTSVTIDTDPINLSNVGTVEVTVDGETNSEVEVHLTDADGNLTATQSAILSSPATLTFDATALVDGLVTAHAVLEDGAGNVSEELTDDATKDTIAPSAGSVAFEGPYTLDGYINSSEAGAPDPAGRPVIWSAADLDPVSAEGRFTDASDAIIAGGNCGTFGLGPTGTGTSGYLNSSCMAAAAALQSDPEVAPEIRWQVRWFDAAGNPSPWASASILVDTLEVAPVIVQPTDGSTVAPLVEMNGTAFAGRDLDVTEGVLSIGSGTADADGDWAIDVTRSAGAHVITVTSTDALGNTASDTVNVTVDLDIPVITSPTNGSILPASFIVYGTVAPGNGIELFEDLGDVDEFLISTTANSTGNWQTELTLPSGVHTIKARSTGGTLFSIPRTYTVDHGVPTVEITTPNLSILPPLIEGEAHDDLGIDRIEIEYYTLIGGLLARQTAVCPDCGMGGKDVTWEDAPPAGIPFVKEARVRAVDVTGNRSTLQVIRYIG